MEGTSAEEGKRAWRRIVSAKRDALTARQREELSARLCEVVRGEVLEPLAARAGRPLAVCVYGAFRSEADPAAVARWCRAHGHRVLAPRIREDGSGMELRELAAADGWRSGKWGVPEPDPARARLCPADMPIDVVLVPGIVFDTAGGRLGYGGGYYDRLYAQRRRPAGSAAGGDGFATLWIGFAYELQKTDEPLPKEPHDLPLAGLATEEGVLWFVKEGEDGWIRTRMR